MHSLKSSMIFLKRNHGPQNRPFQKAVAEALSIPHPVLLSPREITYQTRLPNTDHCM